MDSELIPLTKEEEDFIQELEGDHVPGSLYRVPPHGSLAKKSLFCLDELRNFEFYEDDIVILTPPKAGTTWMQEIVWLIMNDVDLKGAKLNQFYRAPFLDFSLVLFNSPNPYPEDLPKTNENVRK